jgi:hypothetical protein
MNEYYDLMLKYVEKELQDKANYLEDGKLFLHYVEAGVYCEMKRKYLGEFNRIEFFETFDKIIEEKGLTQA